MLMLPADGRAAQAPVMKAEAPLLAVQLPFVCPVQSLQQRATGFSSSQTLHFPAFLDIVSSHLSPGRKFVCMSSACQAL